MPCCAKAFRLAFDLDDVLAFLFEYSSDTFMYFLHVYCHESRRDYTLRDRPTLLSQAIYGIEQMPWNKILRWFFIGVLLSGISGSVVAFNALRHLDALTIHGATRLVEIKNGSTASQLFGRLLQSPLEAWQVKLWLTFNPSLSKIRRGVYQIHQGERVKDVLERVSDGDEHHFDVTFIEGERFSDWMQRFEQLPHLTLSGLSEPEMSHHLGLQTDSLEGWLLPETYYYRAGETDLSIIRRAYAHMKTYLMAQWEERHQNLPFASPQEALILASIVEKETGVASERPLIASVMINRLRKGMRLQTDPSVIYGLGDLFDGNLKKSHLRMQSNPYNTYRHKGLPPTAIAMPSKASVHAALNPAQTKFLYFVSRGDGSHYFSKSLPEHNRAVRKYILGRK